MIDPTSPNDPIPGAIADAALEQLMPLTGPAPIATEHVVHLRHMVQQARQAYVRAKDRRIATRAQSDQFQLQSIAEFFAASMAEERRAGELAMILRVCTTLGVDVAVQRRA